MPRRIDTGVFDKIQSFDDYRKANEEFQRKRMIDATEQQMERDKYQQGLQEFEFRKQNAAEQNAIQRQAIEALAPQRQLAIESGQFELGQARRSQQMQDEILQQMQQPRPQAQQGGGVLRHDVQEINNHMQGMSGASPATTQDAPASPEQMRLAIARMAVVNPAAANAMRAAMLPNSTGGATGMIADRLIEQGVDPLQAILIAKSGVGSGNTVQDGQVKPMQGMTDTLQARNTAEALGTARGTSQGNIDKNATNATTADALIEEAKTLVQQASGSYPGAISTAIQSGLGISTPASQANASLEALGGRLISMMPRMEGPQSDRDVQLYTQMAGRIASPTVPMGDKLAALNTIQNINKHYQAMSSTAMAAAPQNVQQQPAYNADLLQYMTPEERALFQ